MPVFFIHDPALGIITPLDRRYRVRDIPPTTELEETSAIHPKIQPNISDYSNPQEQHPDDEAKPTAPARINREAKKAYEESTSEERLALGKVSDIMSHKALTIAMDKTLEEAWKQMQKYEIHHMPIVDDQQKLCGMLSETNILSHLMRHPSNTPANTPLDVFCQKPVLSTGTGTDVTELAQALLEHGLDGVPVTENGALVGVITNADIMKVILRQKPFEVNA